MNVPDNHDMFVAEEQRKQQMLDGLPKCAVCGHEIQQDFAVCIDGFWICDNCLEENRKDIEL